MTKSDINKLSLTASNCSQEDRKVLFEIIEHEKKFMWHDLRENPEDLPKQTERILFVTPSGNFYSGIYEEILDFKAFENDDSERYVTQGIYYPAKGEVIKWRYIDTESEDE